MTVYFSLVFLVMVSLICASIVSVKVSTGRMQAANAADQALFSLFARYDRQMMDRYDLFFIDAQNGAEGPDTAAVIREIRDAAEYVLNPGKDNFLLRKGTILNLRIEDLGLTGYTLATDAHGAAFAAQAVDSVRDTGAIQSISFLKNTIDSHQDVSEQGAELLENTGEITYADALEEANEEKERREEERRAAEEAGEVYVEPQLPAPPEDFQNPIPMLERLKKMALFALVVPSDRELSEKKADLSGFVSHRNLARGMGIIDTSTGSLGAMNKTAFVVYVYQHYNSFRNPSGNSALTYQIEYILEGKNSDRKNLKWVLLKLLGMREGYNIAALYRDSTLSDRLDTAAYFISLIFKVPKLKKVFKAVLAGLWAFVESAVDLKALLQGKKVPVLKSYDTWQLSIDNLSANIGNLDGITKDTEGGFTYEQYLCYLMLLTSEEKLILRAMDMAESELRGMGRESFRLDACIGAVSTEIKVRSENRVTYPVEMTMDYRDLSI